VTDVLLELISEGLGLEKNVLKASLGGDQMEIEMKINLYPPCPQPQLALGVEPHTDMSAVTILVPNDVPGLQVWKDGNWFAADYLPNALFCHIGDQIEVKCDKTVNLLLGNISYVRLTRDAGRRF